MNPISQLPAKQQQALLRAYVTECFLLRDKVKEAYFSRREPPAVAPDVPSIPGDHIAARLFEALSEANFVLEGITEIRRQDTRYYHKRPEELPGVLERVIHLKYALESSYRMHLYDMRSTLEKLRG